MNVDRLSWGLALIVLGNAIAFFAVQDFGVIVGGVVPVVAFGAAGIAMVRSGHK